MKALDGHCGIEDAIVEQKSCQVCQRGGRISGNSDRGGIRRHERVERIPESLPGAVDLLERVNFEQGFDSLVLSMLVRRVEKPSIHLAAFVAAPGVNIRQSGLRMLGDVIQQPKLQRMNM